MKTEREQMQLWAVQDALLLVGEAAWIYPWSVAAAVWIARAPGPVLALPALVGLLMVATAATRLAARAGRAAGPARAAVVALGLVAAGLVALWDLPAPWVEAWDLLLNTDAGGRAATGAVVALFVWWRGVGLGRSRPGLATVEDRFRTGIIAMASLLALAAAAGSASPLPEELLVASTLAVVSAGLVGMPLARVAEVGGRSRHREGPGLAPGGPWLAMLLGVVGGLLAATLLLAQLLTFQRIAALWDAAAAALGGVLWAMVYVLALPIGLLLEALFFLIRLLVRPGDPREQPQPADLQWLDQLRQQGESLSLPPELLVALKVAVTAGLGVAAVWILLRAISRLQALWQQEEVEEERDSVWSWPGLGALWRRLLARLRPLGARAASAVAVRRGAPAPALSVRELYRRLLALGAALGRARLPAETPLEYERRLLADRSLPGADEVRSLTGGYNLVRYAPPSPEPPDPRGLALALARLRDLWCLRSRRPG